MVVHCITNKREVHCAVLLLEWNYEILYCAKNYLRGYMGKHFGRIMDRRFYIEDPRFTGPLDQVRELHCTGRMS